MTKVPPAPLCHSVERHAMFHLAVYRSSSARIQLVTSLGSPCGGLIFRLLPRYALCGSAGLSKCLSTAAVALINSGLCLIKEPVQSGSQTVTRSSWCPVSEPSAEPLTACQLGKIKLRLHLALFFICSFPFPGSAVNRVICQHFTGRHLEPTPPLLSM